jgi:hypothetical protein
MTRQKPLFFAVLLLLCLGACRAPSLTTTDTATPMSTLPPAVPVKPSSCVMQYASPTLGFAVQYPCGWEVADLAHGPCIGDSNRLCDALNFQTRDAYGNYYGVSVLRYWPAMGETITDTVEYGLRNLEPRDQIKTRCCLTVGGEPAMKLTFPALPEDRFRNRHISVVHNGGEYTLMFWWNVPFQPGGAFGIPAGSEAQAMFDLFLRTFAFIPIAETPTPPPPVPTPVPTPTRTPTPSR